jgi:anti-sigma B factor antagonist
MYIRETIEGDALTLALEGRLDTMTAPQLEEKLAVLLPNKKALALDFAALDYLSSAGLRVILAAQKRMQQQGDMVIRHVNEARWEVLEQTGFLDILTVEADECAR